MRREYVKVMGKWRYIPSFPYRHPVQFGLYTGVAIACLIQLTLVVLIITDGR